MTCLIIGLGSIAIKHIKALKKSNVKNIYALRSNRNSEELNGVINLYSWEEIPKNIGFILISNPTSKHFESIFKASEMKVPLFIEKPPLMDLKGADILLEKIEKESILTYTAFNLRFHPVIKWIKENTDLDSVLEIQSYCGSYLPNWRKKDYRSLYSSKKELGGGVHLDLIHEMDFIIWIFGQPSSVNSYLRKISNLEINSIDSAYYFLQYPHYNAKISLNYFRRDPKRQIEIVFKDTTWNADLINGNIKNEKEELLFETNCKLQFTYDQQMKYFIESIKYRFTPMNSLSEALKTLKYAIN